jgi:IS5 family transposase
MTFNQFVAREMYIKVRGLGDRLALMKDVINWKRFRPIVASVFYDDKVKGGRPHTDEIVVVKALVLQGMYGLSDQELEFQCNDRLSFRAFLDFPEKIPDFVTIWNIRDRLRERGKEEKIWNEFQNQLDQKGLKIEKGVIQDASFIEAEYGRKRKSKEKKAEKEGKKIEYTPKQLAHMDKDGSYSVKHGQVHYGYKLHAKSDVKHGLIREVETTTAKDHDSTVDLLDKTDGTAYRDKGYCFMPVPDGVIDMTSQRATRGHPLSEQQKERNRKISKIRSPGERPFAVIKEVFHSGTTFVTTRARVHIKNVFICFGFNLYQLVTLERRRLAKAM